MDDIELAQLVFLLPDNTRINKLIDQLTSKAVVILSRFEPEERKQVIEQLRRGLRKHGFLPIVFDFERPPARDLTETIKALVGLWMLPGGVDGGRPRARAGRCALPWRARHAERTPRDRVALDRPAALTHFAPSCVPPSEPA